MKTIIRAPLLSVSGYGVHSRQVYSFLEESKSFDLCSQVVNWGNTSWLINPDFESGQVGRIMATSNPAPEVSKLSVQVQLPDEWDPSLAGINVGVSAVIETDKCNPEWVEACNKMDAVIVPSRHAELSLRRSGTLTCPTYVVPEWYHTQIESSDFDEAILNKEFETEFNFLIVSQITGNHPETDRKNLFYTIKWFCETFQDDPTVGLIIKTNHGRGTRIDRGITRKLIGSLLNEVRIGQFPRVNLLHGNLNPSEIASLYKHKSTKALISLTRGEGFGLPILEAAASNLPVITTSWSAHTEFLALGKYVGIDYNLVDVPEMKIDGRIFVNETRWANPSEIDFKKKIKKFRQKHTIPKQWANDLGIKIREEYSKNAIMKKYESVFKEIIENA